MRTFALLLGLLPATLPLAAQAEPGTQLLRLVAQGLREYSIEADVNQLTTAQASAIHLIVSSPPGDEFPLDSHVRQEIRAVLRWNDATNPDLH